MRDYKIGDWVIWIDKKHSNDWKQYCKITLYKKVAKIIDIDDSEYLLEFKEHIDSGTGWENGKKGHCIWCENHKFKLAINYLKFKKWIKG